MIALHAALLARQDGQAGAHDLRPPRGPGRDDEAPPGGDPPPDRRDDATGRIVAQDIDLVIDGGAYTTLTPVVLSRATIHAGGPYDVDNVRIRSRAVATNTPPNGAFRGFGAPQSEFAAEMQVNRAADALGMSPLEIRRRNVYRPGGVTPTQQVLRRRRRGHRGARAGRRGVEFERVAGADGRRARRPHRRAPAPRAGVGLALAWHGAGFTGSGEEKMGSIASLELHGRRPDPDPHRVDRDGPGDEDDLPAARRRRSSELDIDDVEMAPQDTSFVPDSGPTVASRTAMVVGGLLIYAARRLKAEVEGRTGRPFGLSYRDDAREHGPTRIDEQFEPVPGPALRRRDLHRRRLPVVRLGGRRGGGRGRPRHRRGRGAVGRRGDDVGRVIHPVLCEGQVEGGTLQAVGYATIEEIKLLDGRYLNDRLATYIIPTALDAPRLETILVEAPFADAPHGAKGVGELPMDVGAPAVVAAIHDATGPGSTTCRRRRSGSSPRSA